MKKEFKFVVEHPKDNVDGSGAMQIVKIMAEYPIYAYACPVGKYNSMSKDEHIRLAIAELKVRLIADISTAEFTFEYR
jgi:hypothetical protein